MLIDVDIVLNKVQKLGKTYWKEIFAVFLLLVGIYFFRSERRELSSVVSQLHTANPTWIFFGVIITLIYILLQAAMYVSSYAAIGAKLRLANAIELFLKRNFLSVFLPAGGISSLAFSPSGLRKSGISKLQSHQAAGIYAFVGIFTVLLIGLPLIIYSLFQFGKINNAAAGLIAVIILLAVVYFFFISIKKKRWLYFSICKYFPGLIPKLSEIFSAEISTSSFLLATAYSLGIEFCGIAHLFIAANAFGISISFESSAIAYVVTVLLMIVSPFLRGLGAVELSMVYILGLYRIQPVNALAVTILYRFFEFWLPLLAGFASFFWQGRHIFARLFPALLVFGLGGVNLLSVITPPIASRLHLLKEFLPAESINASNLLVFLVGLVLIVLSAFLIRGQKNAWLMAMILSTLSLLGHIFKALDYEEAILAASVIIVLALSAKQYPLKTPPSTRPGFITVLYAFAAVFLFGCIGFYFFEPKHFGFSFSWWQSIIFSAKAFLLFNDDTLHPVTRFGREFIWLIHALYCIAWGLFIFVLLQSLFKKKINLAPSRERANELLKIYGDSAVDYFKLSKDKLLFFSDRKDGFIAYRIASGFAIVLEEPVCAEEDKIAILKEFDQHCHKMGLRTAFYRVDESGVSYFNFLKKQKMIIGQEAVLEIDNFSLEGRSKKSLRNALNSLAKKGFVSMVYYARLSEDLIKELKEVSNAWLNTYNRKEMIFSQGMFSEEEIQTNDVLVIRDAEGKLKAFLNIIPDFAPEECTYDMIRKTPDAPGGCMDALIIELINYAKRKGLKYLNLGLVPMANGQEPQNTAEQLVRYAYARLKNFQRYSGLREFKEKYASTWVNKYLVYDNDFDLLRLPIALNKIMRPQIKKASN